MAEISAIMKRNIARHDFLRRQITKLRDEPFVSVVNKILEGFEEELHHWRGVVQLNKDNEARRIEKLEQKIHGEIRGNDREPQLGAR